MILTPVIVRCSSNDRSASSTSGLLAPAAQTSVGSCRVLLPPVAGCEAAEASPPPTTPTAGQAIPLLTHTPCYSAVSAASHRSRTSEPSYSSPRGLPLLRLPRLRVVPFLGLAVVHRVLSARRGQRGQGMTSIGRVLYRERLTAGSTAAARKCLLITRKIIIPSPDSRDPPDGPPYYAKKNISPLTAGTQQLHLRAQGSA